MMKKRILSALMALACLTSLSIGTMTAGLIVGADENNTITYDNELEGYTYTTYKLFDIETVNGVTVYKIATTSAWYTSETDNLFAATVSSDEDVDTIFTWTGTATEGEGESLVTYNYYVLTSNGITESVILNAVQAALDGLSLDDLASDIVTDQSDSIYGVTVKTKTESSEDEESTADVVYTGVLTSQISLKNAEPTVEKKVSSSEDDASYGTTASATIADTIYYAIKISQIENITTLVLTDTLAKGIDLDSDSICVYLYANDTDESGIELTNCGNEETCNCTGEEVSCSCSNNGCYTVSAPKDTTTSETTLTITFCDCCVSTVTSDSFIVVTYEASLNMDASYENENKAQVSYVDVSKVGNDESGQGERSTSSEVKATVYTYGFQLKKKNSSEELISGAEFVVYCTQEDEDVQTAGEGEGEEKYSGALYFLPTTDSDGNITSYTVCGEDADGATQIITAGNVTIFGLAEGDYYLAEVTAPIGYSLLDEGVIVKISTTSDTEDEQSVVDEYGILNETINVVNYPSGTELPSTGGSGVTSYVTWGAVLCLGAGALLLTRKRANA